MNFKRTLMNKTNRFMTSFLQKDKNEMTRKQNSQINRTTSITPGVFSNIAISLSFNHPFLYILQTSNDSQNQD